MANEGFFSLGEMIAGGGIDREGAFLEGQDIGSRIQSRRATTVNALAQARLRVDEQEANLGLADAIEELGLPREMAVHLRAGGAIKDLTGGLLQQQEFGNRANLADLAVSPEQRLQSAQAIEVPKDPFQISGGLFANVFNPGDAPKLAPTNPLDDAKDRALAFKNNAAALKLMDQRRNPDRYKLSTTINVNTTPLAEQILPGGTGDTIIPADINAEEAFGAEAFLKGGSNALMDFIGLGTPFEDEAKANTIMRELSARTQIVMRADVPGGGRVPIMVQELLARYAEDPRQLFRGDAKAMLNLESTLNAMKRSKKRIQDQLNSPSKKTPTRLGNLEESLFALADLVADYEAILQSLNQKQNPAAPGGHAIGEVIQLPGGGTAKRIN